MGLRASLEVWKQVKKKNPLFLLGLEPLTILPIAISLYRLMVFVLRITICVLFSPSVLFETCDTRSAILGLSTTLLK